VCLNDGPLFPSKVNSRCAAIMFAVKRNASVPGRIRFLIVSIITMNGINIVGVPCGTWCSNIWHKIRLGSLALAVSSCFPLTSPC
jgi:hypothetical protein